MTKMLRHKAEVGDRVYDLITDRVATVVERHRCDFGPDDPPRYWYVYTLDDSVPAVPDFSDRFGRCDFEVCAPDGATIRRFQEHNNLPDAYAAKLRADLGDLW